MNDERPPFAIPALKTIEQHRSGLLFLETNQNITQIRNVCYLLQTADFMRELNNNYNIRKGLWYMYLYNYLRIEADILEGLLYAFKVRQEGRRPQGKVSLEDLINFAKGTYEPSVLLRKETRKGLDQILYFRNNLHPDKQNELHVKLVKHLVEPDRVSLTNVPPRLINDIRKYYLG